MILFPHRGHKPLPPPPPSGGPTIVLINKSSSSLPIVEWATALQSQVTNDLLPSWNLFCNITATPTPNAWPAYIEDTPDVQGALGYHDVDSNGVPYIKVFVSVSQEAGVSLSSVLSHEVLETLGDSFVFSLALKDEGNNSGKLFPVELCDAVQASTYSINNVEVSNFVLPAYFGAPGTKYDHMGVLTAPFTLATGGYSNFLPVTGLGQWSQETADKRAAELASLFGKKPSSPAPHTEP